MNNQSEYTLGNRETIFFLVNLIATKLFASTWQLLAKTTAGASWIAITYKFVTMLICFSLFWLVYKKFNGRDIISLSEDALGGIGKSIVGLLFAAYAALNSFLYFRVFVEYIKSTILTHTQPVFVIGFIIIVVCIGALFGMQALARFAAYAIPIVMVLLGALFVLLFNKYKISNLFPILGYGPRELFVTELYRVSIFSEIGMLLFLTPFIKYKERTCKIGISALFLGFVILLITNLSYVLVVEIPESAYYTMPMYLIACLVNVGYMFQRMEGFFVLIWIVVSYLFIASMLRLAGDILRRTFNMKSAKSSIIVLSILMAIAEFIFVGSLPNFLGYVPFMNVGLIFFPLIPMIICGICHLKGVASSEEISK